MQSDPFFFSFLQEQEVAYGCSLNFSTRIYFSGQNYGESSLFLSPYSELKSGRCFLGKRKEGMPTALFAAKGFNKRSQALHPL